MRVQRPFALQSRCWLDIAAEKFCPLRAKKTPSEQSKGDSACRKTSIYPRSGFLKSIFCLSSAEAKNTSIRTSVRFGGISDKPCAQCGCFGGKVPSGLFRRSESPSEQSKGDFLLSAAPDGGEEGIRTLVRLPSNGFQDRLVMTTSILLRIRQPPEYRRLSKWSC